MVSGSGQGQPVTLITEMLEGFLTEEPGNLHCCRTAVWSQKGHLPFLSLLIWKVDTVLPLSQWTKARSQRDLHPEGQHVLALITRFQSFVPVGTKSQEDGYAISFRVIQEGL